MGKTAGAVEVLTPWLAARGWILALPLKHGRKAARSLLRRLEGRARHLVGVRVQVGVLLDPLFVLGRHSEAALLDLLLGELSLAMSLTVRLMAEAPR